MYFVLLISAIWQFGFSAVWAFLAPWLVFGLAVWLAVWLAVAIRERLRD